MNQSHKYTNQLIHSKSPYLLQHAHNPVNWYPWGDEAFEIATRENKPIFLSIGYSTCHWCHVMAHESFEDEEVAKLLNENFICIKVDREERPDIDQFYMTAATSLIGRGGWPLTIIMGPDKRPFFAGTYFPKNSQQGRVGMLDLLPRITSAWNTQETEVNQAMDQIMDLLKQRNQVESGSTLGPDILNTAAADFLNAYDPREGGFGTAPKFPSPHNLLFLLREGYRTGNSRYTDMALHTLRKMRLGGIYDQIGFGFHRYSTDAEWHVPHFEKMLYDQATLLMAYTEAWEISGDQLFRQTMDEIIQYITDKLKAPNGGYYSAEDADSEGVEGKFYVWEWDELRELIGQDGLKDLADSFSLVRSGNFHDEASGQASGENIFHLKSEKAFLELHADQIWSKIRQELYQVRELRIHPGLDNKILCDWNGLILTALSKAAKATGDKNYAVLAGELADFLIKNMLTDEGTLLHMQEQKEATISGFVDDYSYVIQGLRHYYEVSFDPEYLQVALNLQGTQINHFWDKEQGGFFFSSSGDDDLLVRQKEIYDGALPSGNSVAAMNLYYLGRISENPGWEAYSSQIGALFSKQVKQAPRGFSALLQSVQVQATGSKEIVIAGDRKDLIRANSVLRKHYDPFKVTLYRPNHGFEQIVSISSFLNYQKAIKDDLTVYICENYACQQPLTKLSDLEAALLETSKD